MNKKVIVRTALCAVLVSALGYSFVAKSETKLIPFQGKLTDASGQIIADGAIVVQFKMYDAPVGGQAKWNGEVQMLSVNGGLVNTTLGTKASLKNVDFSSPTYLEITIDANGDNQIGPEDPPLLPRQSIIPAVYAVESGNARTLANHDWSSIFGINDPTGKIPGDKLANESIKGTQIANKTITAQQIKDSTITSAKLAKDAVTRESLIKEIRDSLVPPGTINAFGGDIIPDGWLLCDGRPLSGSEYPALYQAISTNWGAGYYWDETGTNCLKKDNCDFNLPDLRGLFLRGVNGNRSDDLQDPDAKYRFRHITGSAEGNHVGSNEMDALKNHVHRFSDYTYTWSSGVDYGHNNFGYYGGPGAPQGGKACNPLVHNTEGLVEDPNVGPETHPKNAYVNYIIKY